MMYTRSRPKGPTRDGLVIVLGGGIAGLAAAAALADAGRKVIVLEGGDRLGGMHRSVDIGPYTFDVGSIFYEETARLLYLAEGLRELCPPADRVQRRLTPDGQVMHYPFDPGDILKWPRRQQFRAVASLLLARLISRRDGTLEGVCVSQLGRVLFEETGLRNYTTQFNGVTPDQIDEEFYFDRMKFVHAAARPGKAIRSALRAIMGKPYRSKPKVPLRIRPRDGYGPMFELVAADLRARGVEILTGAALRSISGDPGALSVTTEAGTHVAPTVIGALPLDTLHRALFQTPSGLESLDLLTLFVSAGRLDRSVGNVFFNFAAGGGWKRMTVYSRLYPEPAMDREYFSVEVTISLGAAADAEAAFARLTEHLGEAGLAEDLRLEGSRISPAAYPLYRPGAPMQVGAVLDRIEAAGVTLVGRAGRFEYLPTSSGVIRRTREVLDRRKMV